MAGLSPICPERGIPCAGREWLRELQDDSAVDMLGIGLQAFSDNPFANKLARAWDLLGGHRNNRKQTILNADSDIEKAAEFHELLAKADLAKLCREEVCGTMARIIINIYKRI